MIVDAHVHLGPGTYPKFSSTVEEVLEEMNLAGVNKAIVFPQFNADAPGDYKALNHDIARVVKQYPDRLIGFARVNTSQRWCGAIAAEMLPDLKGVKIHEADDFMNIDNLLGVAQMAATYDLPILLHGSTSTVERVCREIPLLKVIWAHMGGLPADQLRLDVVKIMQQCPRVYLDTSGCIMPSAIRQAVKKFGSHRLVMGSDYPVDDMPWAIRRVELARLSKEDFDKIMGKNMLEVLEE